MKYVISRCHVMCYFLGSVKLLITFCFLQVLVLFSVISYGSTGMPLADPIIKFQSHITPEAHFLGDLVTITPDQTHLRTLVLDSTPNPGQLITKKQIIRWITHKKGTLKYQWRGKKEARVASEVKTSGEDLLKKAETELKHVLQTQDYSRVEIHTKTQLKASSFPLSAFTVQFKKSYPSPKRLCVRLNYNKHSIPVWFRIKAYKKVLITKHKLKTHTLIQTQDFIIKERNIAGLNAIPYSTLPSSMRLQKSLNEGRILTSHYVSEIPAITKGQKVSVKVTHKNVSLIMQAKAQQDAYIGQTIKMRNLQTNKGFLALVTSNNVAEIS